MIKFSENIDIIDRKVYNIVINCEMRGENYGMTLLILIILAYAIKAVMDFINQNGSGILMLLFELVLWLIKLPVRVAKTIRVSSRKVKRRISAKAGKNAEESVLEQKYDLKSKEDKEENRSKFMIFLDFAILGLVLFFSIGAIYKTIPREYEMHDVTYKLPQKYEYDPFEKDTDVFDLDDVDVIWVEYYEDYAKDEKDKEWKLSFYSGDIEDNIWYSDVLGTKVAKNTSNPQRQMFAFFLDNDMYCFRTTCYTDYYAEKVDKDEFEKLISSIKLRE